VWRRLRGDNRSAVALFFAAMAVVVIGMVGIAIDFGIWNENYSTLSLAASSAALNAAKTAANADLLNDPNYIAEGQAAGQQWFPAELGQGAYAAQIATTLPTVSMTVTATNITATVTYTSTVNSIFGKLFSKASYPITVSAAATMPVASYVEVIMMLDNSASMAIGGTTADMLTLSEISPCDPANEFVRTAASSTYSQATPNNYGIYQYSWNGKNYDGTLPTPITSGSSTYTPTLYRGGSGSSVAYCDATAVSNGYCQNLQQCAANVNGYPAYAGPPCAFACHSDGSNAAGLGTDLWAAARRNGVTLRFDLLKNATNLVLDDMQSYNITTLNNLSVGIYTFNTKLNAIYPGGTTCTTNNLNTIEACSNFATAEAAVGSPPAAGSGIYTDTGIQPAVAGSGQTNNDDTAYRESMNTLATTGVTAAGNGTSAATPKKVLFLVTDGFEDDPNGGARDAMPSSSCQAFKNLGFTVYVVYTPYYPVMHSSYLSSWIPVVEGTGSNSITYNLTACASAASDYISASNQTTLNAALEGFLKMALNSPASFTK